MDLGIIGFGTIGRMLAEAIWKGQVGDISLKAVLDVFIEPPFKQVNGLPHYATRLDEFLDFNFETAIESASQSVLKECALPVLASGKNLILMSTGTLSDNSFFEKLVAGAKEYRRMVKIPSGAIGGLDALLAAGIDDIVM